MMRDYISGLISFKFNFSLTYSRRIIGSNAIYSLDKCFKSGRISHRVIRQDSKRKGFDHTHSNIILQEFLSFFQFKNIFEQIFMQWCLNCGNMVKSQQLFKLI